jgi:uncharacterized OsmC-like protein
MAVLPRRNTRPSPASESCLTLRLDGVGKHPVGQGPQAPLEHLAHALGGCLLEFVGRFQERRGQRRRARAEVEWRLGRGGELCQLSVTLWLPEPPSAAECTTIDRLLESCPVHQALAPGVPVAVVLATDLTAGYGEPQPATGEA